MNRSRLKALGVIPAHDAQPVTGSTSTGRSYGTIGARAAGSAARSARVREAYALVRRNQVPAAGGGALGRLAREIRATMTEQERTVAQASAGAPSLLQRAKTALGL